MWGGFYALQNIVDGGKQYFADCYKNTELLIQYKEIGFINGSLYYLNLRVI